jgi:hypothetical protein
MPQITKYLEAAAHAVIEGDEVKVDRELANAGITGMNSVHMRIQAGIPPPLRPETVARRARRTPGSRYRRRPQPLPMSPR